MNTTQSSLVLIFCTVLCNNLLSSDARPQQDNEKEDTISVKSKIKRSETKGRCGKHNVCGTKNLSENCTQDDVNSFETKFGEWPHMCAILKKRVVGDDTKLEFWAGASLISPGILLTAAHWVNDYTNIPDTLMIRCGVHTRPTVQENNVDPFGGDDEDVEKQPAQDRDVAMIVTHPAFESKRIWNDVGMLFVQQDFEITDHISPVCIPSNPDDDSEYMSENCVATGWGRNKYDGDYASILKKVSLPIVSDIECNQKFRASRLGRKFTLHKSMICAGGEQGQDTCKGDGGGPLICPSKNDPNTYLQVGITAWGIGCGTTQVPGVYASIPTSLCFIAWASKCVHGDEYVSEHFNILESCDNWVEEEADSLQNIKDAIEKKLDHPKTKELSKDKVQKYQDLLVDVEGLQSTLSTMQNKCNSGGMKLDSIQSQGIETASELKAQVRVADISG